MRNLADAIENFIIRQLLEDREDAVLVQRNELADKLSCAPVSYTHLDVYKRQLLICSQMMRINSAI